MEYKDLVSDIVDQVYFFQENADKRFGGFHYGNDYVIRDFVAERKDKRSDPSSGAVISEVFRAPYDAIDQESQNRIFDRVKQNYVKQEIKEYMKARNIDMCLLPRA